MIGNVIDYMNNTLTKTMRTRTTIIYISTCFFTVSSLLIVFFALSIPRRFSAKLYVLYKQSCDPSQMPGSTSQWRWCPKESWISMRKLLTLNLLESLPKGWTSAKYWERIGYLKLVRGSKSTVLSRVGNNCHKWKAYQMHQNLPSVQQIDYPAAHNQHLATCRLHPDYVMDIKFHTLDQLDC